MESGFSPGEFFVSGFPEPGYCLAERWQDAASRGNFLMKPKPKSDIPLEDSAAAHEVAARIRELQPMLLEFAAGLLGGADGADDVVQETNLFLWERRGEYEPGSDFRAWAMRVARFKVMAARRDQARENRLRFSDEMIERLAGRAEERVSGADLRLRALTECLARTRPQDRRLLEWKYAKRGSLTELAELAGESANSIHKKISRLRLALRHCVEKRISNNP